MKKKKFTFERLMENRYSLRIFSIFIAILIWLAVAFAISPIMDDTKKDIPVTLENHTFALTTLGLNVIDISADTVSANVRGERAVVGGLTPDQLTATVRLTAVSAPNTYELDLVPLNSPTDDSGYQILSYSPSRITVRFDQMVSETFRIEPIVNGLSTGVDYTFDRELVSPEAVTVTGPQAEIDRIARCVVRTDLSEPLTGTYTETLPILLEDAQGNPIDLEERHLLLDLTETQLVVRVLRNKGLALDIQFLNMPRGFDINSLEYKMSETGVLVAAPEDLVNRYREIVVGVIDMKELTVSNSSFVFDVEMPTDDFMNLDNIHSVEITFDTTNWAEVTLNVDNILLLNPPTRFNVKRINESPLYNVTFVGDAETLESLSADDILAEVDLSEKEWQTGQYRSPSVKFSAPSKDGPVWAIGDHSVVIQVEEK